MQGAISAIKIVKVETRGSKPQLTLEQKVLALLLKHLIGKSNRNMSSMLVLFMWLTEIDVSYKTIERLYSDQEVILALHNLHVLILIEEYFQRNQSESGIAEDKKRVGWKLGQKREDRIDTANMCTTLWHNLYWLG